MRPHPHHHTEAMCVRKKKKIQGNCSLHHHLNLFRPLRALCRPWWVRAHYIREIKAPDSNALFSADCTAWTSLPPQLLWEYVLAVGGRYNFRWPPSKKRSQALSQRWPLEPPSLYWPACFIFYLTRHFCLMKFGSITGRLDRDGAGKVFSYQDRNDFRR